MCFSKSSRTPTLPPVYNNQVHDLETANSPNPEQFTSPLTDTAKMSSNSHNNNYAPPPGPPPSHSQTPTYAPPPGPPPSQTYAPPAGPPPKSNNETYAPPPGPPPAQHPWREAVPDNSELPPPPSLGYDRSSANNATTSSADRGQRWTAAHPLQKPVFLSTSDQQKLVADNISLHKPSEYVGSLSEVRQGHFRGVTKPRNDDNSLISDLPLYSVQMHSPISEGNKSSKTVYFEVKIGRGNREEVCLALGYVAKPFPTFRLPGWERASVGVHGDDGHKYVNDRWGGKGFTDAFRPGEVLGIGMAFREKKQVFVGKEAGGGKDGLPSYEKVAGEGGGKEGAGKKKEEKKKMFRDLVDVEVFFTRNGREVGRWDLHEEGDAVQDGPVEGLEGAHDLFAAVGTFEDVDFEIIFDHREWMYRI